MRRVLRGGATLLVQPVAGSEAAAVQVWVRAGSIHEGALAGAGVSHFLEHMVFKGTAHRVGPSIAAEVEACGGALNAYTTHDRTVYHIDLPAAHVGLAMDVLADLTLSPLLPEDEFAREREVILREIAMGEDDPDQRLAHAVMAAAFRVHPQRFPVIGLRERFERLTHADLVAAHRMGYAHANMVWVVSGGVEPAAIASNLERILAGHPDRLPAAPIPVPAEPRQLAPRAERMQADFELGRVGLAWPLPGIDHPDVPVLDLLATLLGGGESSVLWQDVRERAGLVHAISAASWTPAGPGLFWISFICDPERAQQAEEAVRASLARCAARGFSAAALRKAVRQIAVAEINAHKTAETRASRLAAAEVIAGDLHFPQTYFARLGQVTPADVRRVLRERLRDDVCTTVSLLPPRAEPALAAPSAPVRNEPVVETLPTGARLVLLPDDTLPQLHLRLLFLGGPDHEPGDRRGSARLLATLLTKDTRRRSAAAIAEAVESAGGVFFPHSGNNSLGLGLDILPGAADLALATLAEAVEAPAFRAATLERERAAQLAELQQDRDDVVALTRKLARRQLFGVHPLALDAAGDEAGVSAVTAADLRVLQRRLITADNAVLVAAGDFDARRLAPKLRRLLASLPRGSVAVPAGMWPGIAHGGTALRETQPREQAVVVLGFPAPPLRHEDFYAGEVADELLSGMASELFRRVREERGLAYFVRASRVIGLDAAMFSVLAGTAPEHVEAVRTEIRAELDRLAAGGVGEGELARVKNRLKGARALGLQTTAARALHTGLCVLYGQPADDWRHYAARIDAVTPAQLARFARHWLAPERCAEVVVSP